MATINKHTSDILTCNKLKLKLVEATESSIKKIDEINSKILNKLSNGKASKSNKKNST